MRSQNTRPGDCCRGVSPRTTGLVWPLQGGMTRAVEADAGQIARTSDVYGALSLTLRLTRHYQLRMLCRSTVPAGNSGGEAFGGPG